MPNTNKPFLPIRGLDSKIQEQNIVDGAIYFATDSGRIYVDAQGRRNTMGGTGASIYYASAESVREDLLTGHYFISKSSLDKEDDSPKVGDLIINANGNFYKVFDITEEEFECTLMAISGTGGGGGSGGGGESTQSYIKVEVVGETLPMNIVYGQSAYITYKITAIDTNDSYIDVMARIAGTNSQVKEIPCGLVASGENITIDIGKELYLGNNTIYIIVTGVDSGIINGTTKLSNRRTHSVSLSKSNDFNPRQVYDSDFNLVVMAEGAFKRTVNVVIDNGALPTVSKTVTENESAKIAIAIDTSEFTHGVHTLKATLTAYVNNIEITTDSIEYEIAFRRNDNEDPIVWTPDGYSSEITNYEDLDIRYMVYDPITLTDIETRFYKNNEELSISPQLINYSSTKTNVWSINDYDVGNNNYTIAVRNCAKNIQVKVNPDENRQMDIIENSLVLNLDSSGRTNKENSMSRNTWISSKGQPTAVKFNNFNWYNNGWVTDENGKSCLRISNGASISIPISNLNVLTASSLGSNSLAFEFRFKLRNVQKYETLVVTKSSEDASGNLTITKEYTSDSGVFGKYYGACGLCLGTQEAFFKSTNYGVNVRYKEDEIVNLSVVVEASNISSKPLMYIYVNGILSGINQAGTTGFEAGVTNLEFNSEYCDVDLYKVRIYSGNTVMTSADIVHNYLADIKDATSYDANTNIVSYNGNLPYIDYEKMIQFNKDYPDQTIMPYAVIEVHDTDGLLPYVKGGKKAVAIDFVNPALDYAYEKGIIDGKTYLKSCPSYHFDSKKAAIDVQGTSSQGYPIRNFKTKMKQKDASWKYTNGPLKGQAIYEYDAEASAAAGKDKYAGSIYEGEKYTKWYMDSDIGESTFTWKADYMESSGTHNTGFATFVKTLYDKHPLDYYNVSHGNSVRTTVYGFPMLVFQKVVTGNKITYKFVGKYNYNLDKGCDDTYGFTVDGLSKVRDSENELLPMEKVAECWELLNNQGARCSFTKTDFEEQGESFSKIELTADTYMPNIYYTQEMVYNDESTTYVETYVLSTDAFDSNKVYYNRTVGTLSVNSDFECRYHYDADNIDNCLDGKEEFAGMTIAERNSYILDKMKNLRALAEWIKSTDGAADTNGDILDQSKMNKFSNEFTLHLNKDYCIVYYITTELLHLYDSRGKNMMLASWGPQEEGKDYIWFPIFYDIDTQLGINNSGVPTWDYSVNPSQTNLFSTSNSVLWINFWAAFKKDIMAKYAQLRKNQLTFNALEGYYNARPVEGTLLDSWKGIIREGKENEIVSYAKIGKRPQNIYNIDEYYKYIGPTMDGFINTSGKKVYDNGSFFYCLQGTRELMRYLYLRNRLNFVDSKWHGGAYASGSEGQAVTQEFWSRFDANYPGPTSDMYLEIAPDDTVHKPGQTEEVTFKVGDTEKTGVIMYTDGPQPLDARVNFEGVKSYLRQYMSLVYDKDQLDTVYCDGENSVTLEMAADQQYAAKYTPGLTQQLVYIGGGEYISDLGDLGLKYLDELHIPTLKRLKSLKVGSDIEGYYNTQLNSTNFVLGAEAVSGDKGEVNENAKTLLEEVVLTGLTGLDGIIDVTGSEKLKEFRALRTIISGVALAEGVQIETLHLPATVTDIGLVEPVALKDILETPSHIEEEKVVIDKGLYIEGLTGKQLIDTPDDKTKINSYSIVGGNFGYGSYKLLDELVSKKIQMASLASGMDGYSAKLGINLTNVKWSPYLPVDYGDSWVEEDSGLYYQDNGHFTLVPYTYNSSDWDSLTKNQKIYKEDKSITEYNTIKTLDILKIFIDKYNEASQESDLIERKRKNQFTNTNIEENDISLPVITGLIYIDNDAEYSEDIIMNDYQKYFPNLTIFGKNIKQAYSATYVSVLNGVETIEYKCVLPDSNTEVHPIYPDITPIRLNYDFIGWAQTPDGVPLTKEEIELLVFDEDNKTMKFYAIFVVHTYQITYLNPDDSIIEIRNVPSGEFIGQPNEQPGYDDKGTLPLEQMYIHSGWVVDKNNCFPTNQSELNKVKIDVDAIISQNVDRIFYAAYLPGSVYTNPLDDRYLSLTSDGLHARKIYDSDGNYVDAVTLSGKIVLPTSLNGSKVEAIGDNRNQNAPSEDEFGKSYAAFINQDKITHVFWQDINGTGVVNIKDNAFRSCSNMEYFAFPKTLKFIGSYAFMSCSKLSTFDMSQTTLEDINNNAFTAVASNINEDILIKLPNTIKSIHSNAFSYINNSYSIQIGSPESRCTSLTTIGDGLFSANESEKHIQQITIYTVPNGISQDVRNNIESQVTAYGGTLSIIET